MERKVRLGKVKGGREKKKRGTPWRKAHAIFLHVLPDPVIDLTSRVSLATPLMDKSGNDERMTTGIVWDFEWKKSLNKLFGLFGLPGCVSVKSF